MTDRDDERGALDAELQLRERALRESLSDLSDTLLQMTRPSAVARRLLPLLPYFVLAAVAAALLLRLRRHGLRPMLLLSAGLQLWRGWSALHAGAAQGAARIPKEQGT